MVKIPSPQVFVQGQGSTSADNLNSFVQVCDTAARLATFTGLPNMMVDLLGITAPNDGGGGFFFYANGTSFVSDNFNVIVPNGVTTGAWLRLSVVASSLSSTTGAITFSLNGTVVGRFVPPGYFGINKVPGVALDILSPDHGVSVQWAQLGSSASGFLYSDGLVVQIGAFTNHPLSFAVNAAEVGRFDTAGQFLVGLQTPNATFPGIIQAQFFGSGLTLLDTNATATTDNAIVFARNGNAVGSVATTLTTTAFLTSSDRNLKTLDESRTLNSGEVIDGVSPHEFTWNATNEPDFGFFAQELHAAAGDAVPGAVFVGSPDEEFGTPEYRNWGVDLSKLVPVLWAEIQSLRKRVAQLEGSAP